MRPVVFSIDTIEIQVPGAPVVDDDLCLKRDDLRCDHRGVELADFDGRRLFNSRPLRRAPRHQRREQQDTENTVSASTSGL